MTPAGNLSGAGTLQLSAAAAAASGVVFARTPSPANSSMDEGGGGGGGIAQLSDWQKVVCIVSYSLISVLAIGGNGLVVTLLWKFRRLRTPTNILILNLAVADLMMALFCIPFSYWPNLIMEGEWVLGELMCTTIRFIQVVAVLLSSYTLVAISFDRFLAIVFTMNLKLRLTKRKVAVVLALVWLLALLIASPMLVVHGLVPRFDNSSVACEELWHVKLPWLCEDGDGGRSCYAAYGNILFLTQYAVPLAVLALTYLLIWLRLWYQPVPGMTESVRARHTNGNRRRAVKKMIPMMLLVCTLYAVCWLPQNLLMNFLVPNTDVGSFRYIFFVWWACDWTAMSHSFVNPLIYATRYQRFRQGFGYLLRGLPCVSYDGAFDSTLRPAASAHRRAAALRIAGAVAYAPLARQANLSRDDDCDGAANAESVI